MVEVGIFVGALLVCLAALPLRRSKRVPENIVQFVPKSDPPRVVIEGGGQVIEFKPKQAKGQ